MNATKAALNAKELRAEMHRKGEIKCSEVEYTLHNVTQELIQSSAFEYSLNLAVQSRQGKTVWLDFGQGQRDIRIQVAGH